jgi:flagellar hook assembly protein FlgD
VLAGVPAGILTVREDDVTAVPAVAEADAGTFRLEGPVPQPSSGVQELAVFVPRASSLVVSVHDVAGRRVRSLHEGPAAAGRGRYLWDGTDEAGIPVAAGVYFFRVRGADGLATARSVRIR